MGITGIGPRLTVAEQFSRNPELRGRQLAVEFHTPRGNLLRANEAVGVAFEGIKKLSLEVDKLRKIDLGIKMIEIPAGEFIF